MRRVNALLLVAILAVPSAALAQAPPAQPPPDPAPTDAAPAVDASKLGVSLSRIRRELVQAEESTASDSPLKLSFTVQVIGVAPKIDLLEGFRLEGAIPYGAPTHREILQVLTPKEHSGGAFPISALAVAAAQKLWQLSKKERCEQEIAAYRQMVMQGVPVSAPRCTQ